MKSPFWFGGIAFMLLCRIVLAQTPILVDPNTQRFQVEPFLAINPTNLNNMVAVTIHGGHQPAGDRTSFWFGFQVLVTISSAITLFSVSTQRWRHPQQRHEMPASENSLGRRGS
jgi:hypothetical protein